MYIEYFEKFVIWSFLNSCYICGNYCLQQGVYVFITCVSLFVCLFVYQWNYTKTSEQISMKLGWRRGLGPEQTLLTFGADPYKRTHSGFFSEFL